MRIRNRHGQRGFSLLELSVAAAIYSMGLGSVSLMMMLAVQGTMAARHDTAATMHAASLAERIAMSSDAFGHFIYPAEAATCEPATACPGGAWAASGLSEWRAGLAADLPSASGLVCRDATPGDGNTADPACDGAGAPVIKIFWQAPGKRGAEAEARRHVTRLPRP